MNVESMFHCFLAVTRVKPKTVQQVMMPMLISGWIVGMGVIEYPVNNPWPAASFLYTLALVAGYGLVVEVAMQNLPAQKEGTVDVGQYIFMALFYGNVCLNICGTILGWIRTKGVKKIVRCLESSDARMEKMGIQRDYRIIYLKQLSLLLLQLGIILVFMISAWSSKSVDEITTAEKIASGIAYYYPAVLTSVGDMSYVTLVRFTGLRFIQLNDYLKTMSTTTSDSPQHKRVLEYTRFKTFNVENIYEKKTRDDATAMRAAREYHHELIIISHMINDTFGIQILFSMSVSFILITGLLYYVCSTLLWTSASEKYIKEEIVDASLWLTFYIYRIIVINASCARTSAAAKKTGNIICHLHEPSTKKAFREEIRDFTLQLSQHCLTFTACGFFTLNYGFIQGMIGSITTYLVILIQIGDMPPAHILVNSTLPSNTSGS